MCEINIRDYSPEDRQIVEQFLFDFQNREQALEPDLYLSGSEIAGPYLDSLLDECRESNGKLLMAELAGKPAGYVCFSDEPLVFFDPKTFLRVWDLYVSPEFRGAGVGRALLAAAEAAAAERGHHSVILNVLARNALGRTVYEKCGYREFEAVMMKKIGPVADM